MNRFYHWLKSDQKYSEGVNLYVLYGENQALKNMLLRGESPFGKKKLVQEITKLSKQGLRVKEVAIVPHDSIPDPVEDLPEDVKQLEKLRNFHYKEAGKHRKDLFSDSKEVRKEAAFAIKRHMKINGDCWRKLDYYRKHGVLPQAEAPKVDEDYLKQHSDEELTKMLKNNRAYISKNQKRIKGYKDSERIERIVREINHRVAENEKIKAILNG